MSTSKEAIDYLIRLSVARAKRKKDCLNCKYSYFAPYQESGLCHNNDQVKGHNYPKVVNEWFRCEFWEKKNVQRRRRRQT